MRKRWLGLSTTLWVVGCQLLGTPHGASLVFDGTVVYAIARTHQTAGYFLAKSRFFELAAQAGSPVPTYAGQGHYRAALALPKGWDLLLLGAAPTVVATPSLADPGLLEWDQAIFEASSSVGLDIDDRYRATIRRSLLGLSGQYQLSRSLAPDGQPQALALDLSGVDWPDGRQHPFEESFSLAGTASISLQVLADAVTGQLNQQIQNQQNVQEGNIQQGNIQQGDVQFGATGSVGGQFEEDQADAPTATGSMLLPSGQNVTFSRTDDGEGRHEVDSTWNQGVLDLLWSQDWTRADGQLLRPDGNAAAEIHIDGSQITIHWASGKVDKSSLWAH